MFRKELSNKNFLFTVIHKSGVIIYSYPYLNDEHVLVSSLISAIIALIDNIVNDTKHRGIQLKFGKYRATCRRDNDIIFCLFINNSKHFYEEDSMLNDLIKIVYQNFPTTISDNIVKIDDKRSRELDAAIDLYIETLENYSVNISSSSRIVYRMWLLTKSPNIKIIKKIYQALLEGKIIFMFHRDLSIAYEFAEAIIESSIRPLEIRIIKPEDINVVDLTKQAIYVSKGAPKRKVSKIIESNVVFLNLEELSES